MRDFRRDATFMDGLVRQHWLSDQIADCDDVLHLGSHLLVEWDEATIVDDDAGDTFAKRRPAEIFASAERDTFVLH